MSTTMATAAAHASLLPPAILRAARYARISKDKLGDEHGVANQLADQERAADARGYVITLHRVRQRHLGDQRQAAPRVRADHGRRPRRDRRDTRVPDLAVLAQPRERAEGIEILRKAGVSLIATKGPSLDMSTAYGRAMAGLLGEFDTLEVEVKGKRQQLAYAAQRDAGIRHGGPRHFGSTAAERDAIRRAADALLGGGTVSAITREWERRGLRPPQAPPIGPLPRDAWKRNSVTTILRNPAVAGLRAYTRREQVDGVTRVVRTIVTDEHGEPVRGRWDAALDEATWRAVVALLDAPGRKPPRACGRCSAGWRCAGAATPSSRAPTPPASRSTGATRRPAGTGPGRTASR